MAILADQTISLAVGESRLITGPLRFVFFRLVSIAGVKLKFDSGLPSSTDEVEVITNYSFTQNAQKFHLRNTGAGVASVRIVYGDGGFEPGAAGASVSATIVGSPDVNIASIQAALNIANRLPVKGGVAPGGAVGTLEPVLLGGVDVGALVRSLLTDTAGRQIIAGAGAVGVALVGNPVPVGGFDPGALLRALALDTSGRPIVVGGAAAGVAPVGNPVPAAGVDPGGLVRTQALSTAGIARNALEAGTLGGMTRHRARAAATTNATAVKGAAGKLFSIYVTNTAVTARWIKLHDQAAAPTVGTTAVAWSIQLAAGATYDWVSDVGMAFANGIGYSTTQLEIDTDATALAAAGELHITLGYA